jgi:3-hydroxyisobutyrate dehydrogenase
MTESLRVGFVGIGNMGWPMAANIHAAGFKVSVFDVDLSRAKRFASEVGGLPAATPAALGAASDVVVTMLPSGREVAEVVLGDEGIASALAAGAVIVDMSSSNPVGTQQLGKTLAELGIALVDAPVSGLVAKAETGTLTIMLGADDEAALAKVTRVLESLGEKLVRIGGLGAGHAMKALNNYVAATAFVATAEALIVGKRFGLDPAVMTDVIAASTGRNFHVDVSFPHHVMTRKFATGFSLGLLVKDVGIAGDLSKAVDAKTPLMSLVNEIWAEGRDEIGADEDNSAVVKLWEERNGVTIES